MKKTGGALLFALFFLSLLTGGCGRNRIPVSLGTKTAQLTDVLSFCRPARAVSGMESTYDRRGGNVDWWQVFVPCEGKELYEAISLTGPGCLTRIWQTNFPVTEWLFYFDGETEPRLRLKPEELFSGDVRFNPLQGGTSGGAYSYLPLPYQQSLRVVVRIPNRTPDARSYFHINYEQYPSRTRVVSWPKHYDAATSNTVMQCNSVLRQTRETVKQAAQSKSWDKHVLAPKQATEILAAAGEGMISTLRIRLDFGAANAVVRSLMLRCLVLEAYWDGSPHASIQVPLGDFFCNGLHPREFTSVAMAFVDGVYVCRLPMPFRKGARLLIRNDGPLAVSGEISADVRPGDVADALYLHASFNSAVSAGQPFRMMRTSGQGKYVGCYLIALGMDGGWNILEGDESFYRDGSKTPCCLGTGLEDYFNGGWYYFGHFELPLHGLLEKAAMRTAQYRFHLSDPVTFTKDLRMNLEFGDANRAGGYLSAVAYWYQDRPGLAGSELQAPEKRFPSIDRVGAVTIMDELFELERMGLIADARERCEFYAAAFGSSADRFVFQLRAAAYREMMEGYPAARDTYAAVMGSPGIPGEIAAQAKLLLWRGEKPGRAIFGAHGFGEYKLFVDGNPVGAGNHPQIWQAFPVELAPGEHILEAEIIPHHQYSFISVGFSSFFTNVVSDVSWDYRVPSAGADDPKSKWRPYEAVPGIFPTMAFWQFVPNAFPCVQSGQQHGGPFPGWTEKTGQAVRIRRKIRIPESAGNRPPMPARVYQMPGHAVRPADDTSNADL
ncbi:MAG: DUF2961 domain-containing protein [Kiritimatiellae bacterium]|nr:DUF2961 domain-containing protein [Kiritimatiellia bacterium]